MSVLTLVFLVLGLALLTWGADLLVAGASRLALIVGVTPLVVGLTIVAFGTSAPELAVSAWAAAYGQPDIAVGNVVGSNLFNVLFILGVTALIAPVAVAPAILRRDLPVMALSAVAMSWVARDGKVGSFEGLLFVVGIVAYTTMVVRQGRTSPEPEATPEQPGPELSRGRAWAYIVTGLAMLVGGSRLLTDAAVDLARLAGVSELVIGLTIVAGGTSLPELATSVVAGLRGHSDIAVGNIVGSNIFNVLSVLGFAALAAPDGLAVSSAARAVDLPLNLGVSFACIPVFLTASRIDRWEGGLFLGSYLVYVVYLVLDARGHGAATSLADAVLKLGLPATVAVLGASSWCAWTQWRRAAPCPAAGGRS